MEPPAFLVTTDAASQTVDAWSNFRLPFEPKGVKRELRIALANALRALTPSDGQRVLHGTYSSPVVERADLENVLLYNVGCAPFRALARDGLVIERTYRPPPGGPDGRWNHHSRYATGPAVLEQWGAGRTILEAELSGARRVPKTAAEFWLATKTGTIRNWADAPGRPELGLQLHVAGTAVDGINWTERVKPLLDGLTSALHVYSGPELNTVSSRASEALGVAEETVARWLADGTCAALGPKTFVWPFRTGLQWSPDDDRFVAVSLDATVDREPGWHVHAELFEAVAI